MPFYYPRGSCVVVTPRLCVRLLCQILGRVAKLDRGARPPTMNGPGLRFSFSVAKVRANSGCRTERTGFARLATMFAASVAHTVSVDPTTVIPGAYLLYIVDGCRERDRTEDHKAGVSYHCVEKIHDCLQTSNICGRQGTELCSPTTTSARGFNDCSCNQELLGKFARS
jgi:hypothetical protein